MPASRMKRPPVSRVTLPSLNLPTRIFGPCRSHRMATVRPTLLAISLTIAARLRWSSAVPCEKLSRTTSTPARTMRSSTAGSLEDGPRVATIFVLRNMKDVLGSLTDPAALDDGLALSVARLESNLVANARRVHRERARHQHHAGEAATHAPHRLFHCLPHFRYRQGEGRSAMKDDSGQAGLARVLGLGVDRIPDARAFGVDMRRGRRHGDLTDRLQFRFVLRRIFRLLEGALIALDLHAAVEHPVVGGAHRIARGAARLHAHDDEGARTALRDRDDAAGDLQRLAGARRAMDHEIVLRVNQTLVQRLQPARDAQRAIGRPLVADGEERVRSLAHFAERGVVRHQPAQIDRCWL